MGALSTRDPGRRIVLTKFWLEANLLFRKGMWSRNVPIDGSITKVRYHLVIATEALLVTLLKPKSSTQILVSLVKIGPYPHTRTTEKPKQSSNTAAATTAPRAAENRNIISAWLTTESGN